MNIVILSGNIGQDPVLRHTGSGKAVLNFSLAVDKVRRVGDQTVKDTKWFDVTCWGDRAEHNAKYLTRGSRVAVEGELNDRRWQDKDGNNRRSTEIVASKIEYINLKPQSNAQTAATAARP